MKSSSSSNRKEKIFTYILPAKRLHIATTRHPELLGRVKEDEHDFGV
jgi:hypothetical protein